MSILSRTARVSLVSLGLLSAIPAQAVINGSPETYGTAGVFRMGGGCSSVALSKRWLLTANHCVSAASVTNPGVVTVNLGSAGTATATRVVRHPEGTHVPGGRFDVALFRIDRDVPRSSFPAFSTRSVQGALEQPVICMGYGVPGGGQLRSATLTPTQVDANPTRVRIFTNLLGQNTAPGDSGAPCFTDSTYRTIGLLSSAYSGDPNNPSHTRHHVASTFAAWATKVVNWQEMPGRAVEIATSADGDVVIVGQSNASADGNKLYRWTGSTWAQLPFQGKKVAVEDTGRVWTITTNGTIRRALIQGYQTLPGKAAEIAIGGGQIYILGRSSTGQGGRKLYRWTGSAWQQRNTPSGGAVALDVDDQGNPWVTTPDNRIQAGIPSGSGLNWVVTKGKAVDLDIAGKSWVLGQSTLGDGGKGIFRWTAQATWERRKGLGAVKLATGADGRAWVIGADRRIYRFGAE
ncbi:MAG: trypsin-like serine protease [Pseudomonadota bacterium]